MGRKRTQLQSKDRTGVDTSPNNSNSSVLIQVEKNTSDISEILRRLDSQDRYLELIYKDRELLNDLRDQVAGLKQRVVDNHQHVDNVSDEVKFEVNEVKKDISNKVDEIKADVVKSLVSEKKMGIF